MKISKRSQLSGKIHVREIPVDGAAYQLWKNLPDDARPLIQNQFPDLSADDREFLLTGITPEEWEDAFGDMEED